MGTDQPSAQINNATQYAGIWRRLFAFIIDSLWSIVPLMVVILLFGILGATGGIGMIIAGLLGVAAVIWLFFYHVYFEGKYGQTLGMRWLSLKVIRKDNEQGSGIGYALALGRYALLIFVSTFVFNLGNIWMLIDNRRQTWHDKICKTVVLYSPQKDFATVSLDQVNFRKKQVVWFIVLLLLVLWGALSR